MQAGDVGVVDRERALDAGAEDRHVRDAPRRLGDRVRLSSEATSTVSQRAAAASSARVPFVVVSTSCRRMPLAGELARRVAEVEALDADVVALARERDARAGERACVLDLADADDPLVAARKRLADVRGRPQDVDDDAHGRRDLLGRSEPDSDLHDRCC